MFAYYPAETSDLARASFLAPGNATATVTSSGVWIDPPVSSYAQAPTARSIKKNTEVSKYAFVFSPRWDRKAAQSYRISLDSIGRDSGEQYVNRRNYENRTARLPALLLHRPAPKKLPNGPQGTEPHAIERWLSVGQPWSWRVEPLNTETTSPTSALRILPVNLQLLPERLQHPSPVNCSAMRPGRPPHRHGAGYTGYWGAFCNDHARASR